uniref:Transcription initiation factor TFIID subunit 12 n=1 Tax=Onchocerca volvulus TaxID=6282 RepID=A0A8R1TUK7_ONCVO
MAGVNNMRIHGHIFSSVSSKPVMSDYSGQIMAQQYTVDVSHSPVGLQRIHSSPQQPRQTHMIQSGQMHPQQQMMMQASQPIHMPPCTSMQVQMASMGPPQMISQQGVAIMNQQGQIQQAGAAQGTMMQAQHQMIATGQISPQQMPTQILVTSMGQQQMLSTMVTQVQQQQPAPHQMGPPTAPHLGPQHQPQQSLQQQQQPQQQQQTQQHQMMASTQMLQQQSQGQHSLNTQQSIVHSPGFPHPSQPHMHNPNPNYQQTSPHRATMARYPTPSPENMQHGTPPIYRSPVQRSINTPRVIGQSSAIRQALGHLPPTPTPVPVHSSVEPHPPPPASMKLLEKDAMEALIKTVDPLEAVEDDVSNALLHLVEEFVDDVIEQTARVAKHRSAQKVETKDVQYVLERRYKIFLPPGSVGSVQPADRNPYIKSPATEAHRQRMSLIKKVMLY